MDMMDDDWLWLITVYRQLSDGNISGEWKKYKSKLLNLSFKRLAEISCFITSLTKLSSFNDGIGVQIHKCNHHLLNKMEQTSFRISVTLSKSDYDSMYMKNIL